MRTSGQQEDVGFQFSLSECVDHRAAPDDPHMRQLAHARARARPFAGKSRDRGRLSGRGGVRNPKIPPARAISPRDDVAGVIRHRQHKTAGEGNDRDNGGRLLQPT